jgi:PAS domain S-box-containing protein
MARSQAKKGRKTPVASKRRSRGPAAAPTGVDVALKLVERLPVPVFVKDRQGRYIGLNKAWEEFFGLPRSRILGKDVHELYPHAPEVAKTHERMDRKLWSGTGGESYELPVAQGGVERDAIYYKAVIPGTNGEAAGLIGTIFDVTARKRAEDEALRSKHLLEQTFEHMDQGISIADAELRIVGMNKRFGELLEFPPSLCKPGTPFEAFIRYNAQRGDYGPGEVEEQVCHRVALARKFEPHHFVRERPNGTILDIRGTPLPGGGFVTVYTDITAQGRAERALRRSEEQFRRTFELAGSGVAHIGLDRRFLRVNRRLCEILGYPEEELLKLTGRDISHPEDLDVINKQRPRLYAGEIDAVRVEKRYLRKDRSVVWVAFTMVVERDAEGRPQYEIAVFDDVTARKQAEAALRESEERCSAFRISLRRAWTRSRGGGGTAS